MALGHPTVGTGQPGTRGRAAVIDRDDRLGRFVSDLRRLLSAVGTREGRVAGYGLPRWASRKGVESFQ